MAYNKYLWFLLSAVVLVICISETQAIKCVVCQNCPEGPFEGNHTQECNVKKKEDRCVKMILRNEEVDRGCADSLKCSGRSTATTRKPRSLPKAKPEELTNPAPQRRTIRQLLGAAPESKGGDGKQSMDFEIATMFCCDTDECNSGNQMFSSWLQMGLCLMSFLMVVGGHSVLFKL